MANESPQLPVYSIFKVTTPSMNVTITSDDTPLPQDLGRVEAPANVVTVNLGTGVPGETTTGVPGSISEFLLDQKSLHDEQGTDGSIADTAVAAMPMPEWMVKRSVSKVADALYGDKPVIQPIDESVENTLTVLGEGAEEKKPEPHDYTYFDKLRRQHTRTEIRRWTTFHPEQQLDTPFFGRNIEVDIATEAYAMGTYYSTAEEFRTLQQFKLPTLAYVAPPIWIRRRAGPCGGFLGCMSCNC